MTPATAIETINEALGQISNRAMTDLEKSGIHSLVAGISDQLEVDGAEEDMVNSARLTLMFADLAYAATHDVPYQARWEIVPSRAMAGMPKGEG